LSAQLDQAVEIVSDNIPDIPIIFFLICSLIFAEEVSEMVPIESFQFARVQYVEVVQEVSVSMALPLGEGTSDIVALFPLSKSGSGLKIFFHTLCQILPIKLPKVKGRKKLIPFGIRASIFWALVVF